MYRNIDFTTLAIRRLQRSNWVKMLVLKATADFYGWSKVFPTIEEAERVDYPDGIRLFPSRIDPRNFKGKGIFVCRKKGDKHSFPAGLTNRFRVTNNIRLLDLVAIAQAIQVDYGWLEGLNGHRVSKEHWDSIDLPDDYCHLDLRAAP